MIIGHITLSRFIYCVNIVKIYLSSYLQNFNHMQVFEKRIPTWYIQIRALVVAKLFNETSYIAPLLWQNLFQIFIILRFMCLV